MQKSETERAEGECWGTQSDKNQLPLPSVENIGKRPLIRAYELGGGTLQN